MPTNREIQLIMKLRDEARGQFQKFMNEIEGGAKRLQASFSKFNGIIAGAFSGAALKGFIQESNEGEKSSAKLGAALRAQGVSSGEVRAEMERYSQSLQLTTTFEDDAITNVQALLVSMTGLTGDAVKPLVKATLDLAAGMDMDVESAARMIAKTEEGKDGLSRLGITIGKTTNEGERLAKITEAIEQRFGGMAEAAAGTTAGKMAQLGNSIGNLQEKFGDIIKTVLSSFMPMLEGVVNAIEAAPVPIQAMILAIGGLSAAFLALGISISPVSLAIAGVVAAGVGLVAWLGSAGESTEELRSEIVSLREEQSKLEHVDALIKKYDELSGKESLSAKQRRELKDTVQELAQIMPESVTAWSDEGEALAVNTSAITMNNNARRERLLLQEREFVEDEIIGPMEDATEAYRRNLEEVEAHKLSLSQWKSTLSQIEAGIPGVTGNVGELKSSIAIASTFIHDQTEELKENRTALTNLVSVLPNYVSNVRDFETVEPVLKRFGMQADTIEYLRGKWNQLIVALPPVSDGLTRVGETATFVEGSLGALNKEIADMKKELDKLAPGSRAFVEQLVKIQTAEAAVEDQTRQSAAEAAVLRHEINQVNASYEILLGTLQKLPTKQISFRAGVDAPDDIPAPEFAESETDPLSAFQRQFEQISELTQQGIGIISQAQNQAHQAEIGRINRERELALKSIDAQIRAEQMRGQAERARIQQALQDENLSAAQKLALRAQLDAAEKRSSDVIMKLQEEREKKEEQYAERTRAEKRRAFAADKTAKILESIINTAVAVTRALSVGGPFYAAAVGVLGAAQTAVIASQPVPTFHSGGTVEDAVAGTFFNSPPSKEFPILVRGGETVRTERQEAEIQRIVESYSRIVGTDGEKLFREVERFHDGGTVRNLREVERFHDGWTVGAGVASNSVIDSRSTTNTTETVNHNTFNFTLNFSEKVDKSAIKKAVEDGMRELGVTDVKEYFSGGRANLTLTD